MSVFLKDFEKVDIFTCHYTQMTINHKAVT